jgi:hypothetical protein
MAMTRQPHRLVVLALLLSTLVGVGLAASATTAWAHFRPAPPSPVADEVAGTPAPPAVPAPAPALPGMAPLAPAIALGLGFAAVALLRRRACVAVLALVLVVLALETGVHSVHHLADQQGAAECVVALATAQMHGIADASSADHGSWLTVPGGAIPVPTPECPGARPLRPDEGRAPPAP